MRRLGWQSIYLSIFIRPESTKHNMAITYSGQDIETTMPQHCNTFKRQKHNRLGSDEK